MQMRTNPCRAKPSSLTFSLAGCFWLSMQASAQSVEPPPHLDPVNRSVWSSKELGIRFTYPSAWEAGNPTQDSTRAVVSWRLKKSRALLATCYVEVHGLNESAIAGLHPDEVHKSAESIAESMLKNMRQRAPDAELLTWRATVQDGHPVVYVVRKGTIEVFDRRNSMKLYSLATAWRSREVNFECGTPVFGPEYTNLDGGMRLVDQVEKGILNVMRTLQFDRVGTYPIFCV